MTIASRGATMAVDWEQRIDFARLRKDRLTKAQEALRKSDLGALLLFDPNNIRYVTSTHVGEWARDKNARYVFLPRGYVAPGKLSQTIAYGARIVAIDGNFDDALRLAREATDRHPIALVNSVNRYRLEGQKTAAFEIVDDLGDAPDMLCIPVGNAGNISAYWMGYSEYAGAGIAKRRPVMAGYQAAGAAPFLRGKPVDNPETLATAIRIGHPQSWELAWAAQKESGGWFDEFSDDEILTVQALLAQKEGVYCEPASAISLAGAMRDIRSGRIRAGSRVVCTLTGHGLKDPDIAIKRNATAVTRIAAERSAVEQAILTHLR